MILRGRGHGSPTIGRRDARKDPRRKSVTSITSSVAGSSLSGSTEYHLRPSPPSPSPARYSSIITSILTALRPNNYRTITTAYLQTSSSLHFLFSLSFPIFTTSRANPPAANPHSPSPHPTSHRSTTVASTNASPYASASVPPAQPTADARFGG